MSAFSSTTARSKFKIAFATLIVSAIATSASSAPSGQIWIMSSITDSEVTFVDVASLDWNGQQLEGNAITYRKDETLRWGGKIVGWSLQTVAWVCAGNLSAAVVNIQDYGRDGTLLDDVKIETLRFRTVISGSVGENDLQTACKFAPMPSGGAFNIFSNFQIEEEQRQEFRLASVLQLSAVETIEVAKKAFPWTDRSVTPPRRRAPKAKSKSKSKR